MAPASRLRRYTVVRLVATLFGVGAAAALLLRALRRLLSSRGLTVPGVGLLRFTPTVAPHLPLREVRLETDIPTPPVPGVVYLIVGGLRMSDGAVASADSSCPVEACCQPSATISMLMAWTNVPCHEMVMDLGAKPAWLAQRVGKPDAAKLTTPMAFLNGRWITDSKEIREALRVECGAAASHGGMWAEPPLLSSAAAVEHVGMPTWKAVREAHWTTQADHPCVVAYAPLEAALAKMPFLGGQSPSWADAVAAPWAEGTRAADRLLSAAPRVPLDWASALPNVCAWLDTRMLCASRPLTPRRAAPLHASPAGLTPHTRPPPTAARQAAALDANDVRAPA